MKKLFILAKKLIGLLSLIPCFYLAASPCNAQNSAVRQNRSEQEIVASLTTASEEQRLALLVELFAILKTRITTARPNTIAVLTSLLQSDASPLIRTHAARGLEMAGDSTAADALLTAFKIEREMTTRKTILYALTPYPSSQVTSALLPLLNHKEQEVRATAAFVLAEQADTAAAKPLLEFLQMRKKDSDAFARSQAIRGLGRIGYQTATPMLLESLQLDQTQIVRREAATALGWLSSLPAPQILSALKLATMDNDPYLREVAMAAIERINARASR